MCDVIQGETDIKNALNNLGIIVSRWPSGISLKVKEKEVTLILKPEAVGLAYINGDNKNMQDNAACFEGWAVALKAQNNDIKIRLEVESGLHNFKIEKDTVKESGHYGRFLYRALRFSQQYDWFDLDDNLYSVAQDFNDKIKGRVFNNIPEDDEAGTNDKLECKVETIMADRYKDVFLKCLEQANVKISDEQNVFRQLPVGLFFKKISDNTRIFTGGASAIDLWTVNGDTLQIVELKADNNMIGIITEIFFYSNYMYDLLFDDGVFTLNEPKDVAGKEQNWKRGYACLIRNRNKIEKIQGIMLADSYHSLIKDGILTVLNDNGPKKNKIKYFQAGYELEWNVTIKKKETTNDNIV